MGSEFAKRRESVREDDFYATPPEATEMLCAAERFEGAIWEPACGQGHMSDALKDAGYTVYSSDLVRRGYGEFGVDFLMERHLWAPNIVTNPPFKLAQEFAEHALALGVKKLALLLRINALGSAKRRAVVERLARVHVFERRISMDKGGAVDGKGGTQTYAWFVWDREHKGPPTLHWLPAR